MRIGYLVPEFPSQTHIFFWREIVAMRKLGADLRLISTRRPLQPSRHSFAEEALKETAYLFPPQFARDFFFLLSSPGLVWAMLAYLGSVENTTFFQKLRLIGLFFATAELLRIVRRDKIDHIHAHSCADAAHLLALASLSGAFSYSLTLHGDLPVYGTGHIAKFKRAKFVSVVTQSLQDQVHEKCGLPRERLPVIRMGVDTKRFLPSVVPFGGSMRLITVARLGPSKGHIVALQAMRKAIDQGCDFRYTIVGEGECRPEIEKALVDLNIADRVTLMGTANEDEVIDFLHHSDIFVLSSVGLGEAAPVSVMEAMACGLPVISSIIGGTPEMIKDEFNGVLVPQRDVDGFAAAMKRLSTDQVFFQKLQTEARRTAEQKFSSELFAKQFYEAIVNVH